MTSAKDMIDTSAYEYDVYDEANHEAPFLLQYWAAFMRHKIAIAVIIIICIALGIVFTLLQTPYYTSASRIEINRVQDKVTNVEGLEADGSAQNQEFYQTQYSLLEARSLAERVVRSEKLTTRDEFFDAFGADPDNSGLISDSKSGQTAANRSLRFKLASDILMEYISISPIRGSSLVDVGFSSPDPKLSAQIANAWVDQFIAENLDRRFSSTAEARKFLQEQLATLKNKLEESERNLATYADNKQIITLSEEQNAEGRTTSQKTLASTNLEALNAALAQAKAERISAESAARQTSGNQNALDNSALNNIRQQRATLAAEYARLMVQFEPGYPAAKAIESQIAALDRSIAAEESRAKAGTTARYREALERENELQSEVNKLKGQFSGERRDAIQYNIFQREVDTNRQLYDGLLQRYKEIGVAGVGTNNISIVDKALRPQTPSSPKLVNNVALALLAGLALAAGYVFLREQIDQTIKDPSDLKSKLGLASLGSVPQVDDQDIMTNLQD